MKDKIIINAAKENMAYKPLYFDGEVLVNAEGKKICIVTIRDNKYLFRYMDDYDTILEDTCQNIDLYFCVEIHNELTDFEKTVKFAMLAPAGLIPTANNYEEHLNDMVKHFAVKLREQLNKEQKPAEWSEEDEKILKDCIDMPIPKLPEGLDEAAEESWQNYEYRDIDGRLYHSCYEDGFKAGAKWMAGQGETIEGTLGYGPHLQRPIIMLEGVPKFYDGHSQEVIVQIRKA